METWDTAHYGDSCDCVRHWLPSVSVLYHAGYTPRLAPPWSENWRQQACLLPVLSHRIANVFHIHQRQLNVLYGLLRAPNLWAQGSGPVGATVGAKLGPHTHGCWQRCFFWRGQTGWAARCTEEKSLDLSFLEIEKVLLKMLKKNEVISLLHGLKDVFGKITFEKKKDKKTRVLKIGMRSMPYRQGHRIKKLEQVQQLRNNVQKSYFRRGAFIARWCQAERGMPCPNVSCSDVGYFTSDFFSLAVSSGVWKYLHTYHAGQAISQGSCPWAKLKLDVLSPAIPPNTVNLFSWENTVCWEYERGSCVYRLPFLSCITLVPLWQELNWFYLLV